MHMIPTYEVSAAATHAARTILQNFQLLSRSGSRVKPTEKNLAILVDVCTQIFRVEKVMDHMVRNIPWADKQSLAGNMEQLRDAVRAVELVRNSMHSYGNVAPLHMGAKAPPMSHEQLAEMQLVQNEVVRARTPEEEQKIL